MTLIAISLKGTLMIPFKGDPILPKIPMNKCKGTERLLGLGSSGFFRAKGLGGLQAQRFGHYRV